MKKKATFRPIYAALFFGAASLFFISEAAVNENLDYSFGFIGYGGTFKYNNLRLFGIPIYYMTILFGLALAVTLCLLGRKKQGMTVTEAVAFPFGVLLVCLVGGKALYILENLSSVKKNGVGLDGFSLFGSIFLSVLAAFLICGFKKDKTARLLDRAIFVELILLASVRTGCFLNGCCGANTVWVEGRPIILPIQLIEVFFDLIILDICLKTGDSKGADGRMYPVFLILYSTVRFFLEFSRKTPKDILFLSNGQVFSLVGILLGVILYLYFTNKLKKRV